MNMKCSVQDCESQSKFICPHDFKMVCINHSWNHTRNVNQNELIDISKLTSDQIPKIGTKNIECLMKLADQCFLNQLKIINDKVNELEQLKNELLKYHSEFVNYLNTLTKNVECFSSTDLLFQLMEQKFQYPYFNIDISRSMHDLPLKICEEGLISNEKIPTNEDIKEIYKTISIPNNKSKESIKKSTANSIENTEKQIETVNPDFFMMIYFYYYENNIVVEKWKYKYMEKDYFIKFFKSESQENLQEVFSKELRLLQHPDAKNYFPQIFSSSIEKDLAYYFTEHFPSTLADIIGKKEVLEEQRIAQIIKFLINCLNYFRKFEILLLYFEPSWICITENGFRLIDFKLGSFELNQKYIAPELVEKTSKIRPTVCCIYSLGLIVLEMLNIDVDNLNRNENHHIIKIQLKALGVSTDLQELVMEMICHDPKSRISMKDALHKINKFFP